MDADLLLLTQSALCALYIIMYGKGDFLDSRLDFVHTDIAVKVTEDVLQATLFRNISLDIVVFDLHSHRATTDERGEDILCRLDGNVCIAKGVVLDFQLILEET